MKPYQTIPIQECYEPLVSIPSDQFMFESPHPYQQLGADYRNSSPYSLRQGVLDALIKAQEQLQSLYPGWYIKIFDAYRPLEVQQFMVDYTFNSLLETEGLKREDLTEEVSQKLWEKVYQFWAIPNSNPATPPPHSTGAALDVTLIDETGEIVDMGGEIDEISPRSFPNYYQESRLAKEEEYHQKREILNNVMETAGFCRHPNEWWHFSLGDQMWAWQMCQKDPTLKLVARYGRV